MASQPYEIAIPDATLEDLRHRLRRTRWPEALDGAGWDFGTDHAYLRELVAYWADGFDWRAQEAALNRLPQVRAVVDGVGIHVVHARGVGPNPIPLLLLHGWPDSFVRFAKVIPLLSEPGAHGGDPADAFDVVAPSLPGYGFSDKLVPPNAGPSRIAELIGELMTGELGYARFVAHGGDVGSGVAERIALHRPEILSGVHLTDVPYQHIFEPSDDRSEAEAAYLQAGQAWGMTEGAYAALQSTKPRILGAGLNDSPAGLAAWIVEKFRAWSDCGGDIERRFTKDELLTNVTIYWATETIGSSFWVYAAGPDEDASGGGRVEVPTAVAIFPHDIVPAPRAFAERFFNLQRWTEMPRGGHFAALEEPDLLVEDLRAFARTLR